MAQASSSAGALPTTLDGWLAHLESLHPKGQAGIELGLARVERVRDALAQTPFCPLITVGGTNGKGSTCAYLEAIYSAAGYRVGCYTSPHLQVYNERVRLDRAPIDDAALCAAFARVELARRQAGDIALTYFEFGTLAAWEAFVVAAVDVIILEVGLGGRLDAVNAYSADCAIITGVALDHTDWLGPTRESIGREKAGIFRSATPAICADVEPPQSLSRHAREIGTPLYVLGRDFGHFAQTDERMQWTYWLRPRVSSVGAEDAAAAAADAPTRGAEEIASESTLPLLRRGGLAPPALRGARQLDNAAAAMTAVELLRPRLPVSMQAVRRGLIEIELPGRFQVLPGRPVWILDVAHNPQAASALAESLSGMAFFRRTFAVVGMLADKDIAGTLAALRGRVDVWLVADLSGPRAATAQSLASAITTGELGGEVECFATPGDACARALKLAGEDDRIVAFGSFLTVAAVLGELRRCG
ncbi:bifunctional folylpolyglutamate synthase/dihydrofolate synthase [Rhodocyclus tenuis]|uniref:Dihydrofolate synthase/folylpolyglutamate synthase n=1 Tax=Rhodocyclus gracilis TaxID=2929842 RepID=A0ABX0WE13_9RHOO|nr:folylpolyglutamate synthase/dihydrofolate synthase family protein [Rhodocyclus gracilis]NJA87972.1 bifunctional folylpolyglutamate synthase/dihydrofolate synthase [Rhodocyclus gracilis]